MGGCLSSSCELGRVPQGEGGRGWEVLRVHLVSLGEGHKVREGGAV